MQKKQQENSSYLTTQESAEILSVSDMTVKRWADRGILSCVRVGIGKYRRYLKEEVMKLKENNLVFQEDNASNNSEAKKIQVINEMIPPKPHPKQYLMHKYWGRKAHNVVSEYIRNFTSEGETILDPFMGSGVSVIEGVKANRKAIGVDLNPISTFIVENTLSKTNLTLFHQLYNQILEEVYNKYNYLYETTCPICNKKTNIEIAVWEDNDLKRIRGYCENHGKFKKDADEFDLEQEFKYKELFNRLDKDNLVSYPKDKIHKYVKRNNKNYIYELFSERALIIISEILKLIHKIEDESVKNLLLFSFSSMLPNVSKMLPGDLDKVMYKSGWVISKFWVPKIHTERNVFSCFKMRCEAVLKGKTELIGLNSELANIYNHDSGNLDFLDNESIDYIFTDPPYGESIAYFALSHFWNSWLKHSVNYEREIILDPYRNKGIKNFEELINKVFKELNRVLKKEKYLSLTFHSRELKVWKVILEGVLSNGFELINIVMQPQAVSSGTQGINRKNTLKGDFIYNFKKTGTPKKNKFEYMKNASSFIVNKATEFIKQKGGVNSALLYEYIIPLIAKENAYLDEKGKVINIEKLFKKNFDYVKIGEEYKWICKDMNIEFSNQHSLNVLDLFAGSGGLSTGFKVAGFNIVSAVEQDSQIGETYLHNHPETFLFNQDIKELQSKEISKVFEQQYADCDVIIGGPPCQGFSMSGRRIRRNNKFIDDPRNKLFLEYYRIVKDFNPKVFVIENVEGMLTYDGGKVKEEIYQLFSDLGYNVKAKILNGADYGVPQLRRRAFFIGNKLGIDPNELFPEPTHFKYNYTTVWDAIGDLPSRESGEGVDIDVLPDIKVLSEYQKLMRNNQSYLYNHVASVHKKQTIEKIKLLKSGMTQADLPEEYQTKSVHSGAYGRMEKDKPAHTLTTRLNTPSVGRIIHPTNNRTITPREAARIQSFKDDYRFYGNITSLGIQIGNAVPPLLAQRIAAKIYYVLSNEEDYKKLYPSTEVYQSNMYEFIKEPEKKSNRAEI